MLELRKAVEIRAEGRTLSGYAAVFDRPSLPLTDARGRQFTEFVNRGAFRDSIREGGVWALWNHERGEVLARSPETLALSEDAVGLRFELELPGTTRGNDVAELMTRGVLDGQMSFGFRVLEDRWEQRGDERVRNLIRVDLAEISVVPEAAYPQTNSQLRAVRSIAFHRRRLALASRSLQ